MLIEIGRILGCLFKRAFNNGHHQEIRKQEVRAKGEFLSIRPLAVPPKVRKLYLNEFCISRPTEMNLG